MSKHILLFHKVSMFNYFWHPSLQHCSLLCFGRVFFHMQRLNINIFFATIRLNIWPNQNQKLWTQTFPLSSFLKFPSNTPFFTFPNQKKTLATNAHNKQKLAQLECTKEAKIKHVSLCIIFLWCSIVMCFH